jgi:hypothetical protein
VFEISDSLPILSEKLEISEGYSIPGMIVNSEEAERVDVRSSGVPLSILNVKLEISEGYSILEMVANSEEVERVNAGISKVPESDRDDQLTLESSEKSSTFANKIRRNPPEIWPSVSFEN